MEQQNCVEEITKSENPLRGRITTKETLRGLNRRKHKMTLKPEMTSVQSKVTSSIAITSLRAEISIIPNPTEIH